MKTLIVVAALAACLCTSVAVAREGAASAPAVDSRALDAAFEKHMGEGPIVGAGAAVLVDGKVVWTGGYGFADRDRAVPFTPDTVMNIGSISKTFTGAAMMRAVEEGRLSLDTDINTWLPFKVVNPHRPDAVITLRHLATHTSGIVDRLAVYRTTYHFDAAAPPPLGDFLDGYLVPGGKHYAPGNFLDAAPGEQRAYSNIGAALAGYIVERAVGQPLEAYAAAHVFEPLAMKSTTWSLPAADRARHSTLYMSDGGLAVPIPLYTGTTYPDGGVRTSVADLSRFFAAMLGDGAYDGARILQRPSVEEMRRFQFTPSRKPQNVALDEKNSGLFWATKFNVTRVGHGGSDPGIKTEMLASLDGDVGVILFSNTSLPGDMDAYFGMLEALWTHAEAWRDASRKPVAAR